MERPELATGRYNRDLGVALPAHKYRPQSNELH